MKPEEYLNQLFNALAKRYSLNPLILKEIIILNNRGYSNKEIAEMTGVSRNTVASYLRKLKDMEAPDFMKLILYAILMHGGLHFLPEEVKSEDVYAG
jgi:DNA-binding NarL/FixJ family response regulator